jgi:hypothetical protein
MLPVIHIERLFELHKNQKEIEDKEYEKIRSNRNPSF